MDRHARIYARLRPRLRAIALRILGDEQEAEAVIGEAWEFWLALPATQPPDDGALLVAATLQMSMQRRRLEGDAKKGPTEEPPRPSTGPARGRAQELADEAAAMLMTMLERLPPEARAAYVLHELFAADCAELACWLGKSEAECQELVDQARARLHPGRSTGE